MCSITHDTHTYINKKNFIFSQQTEILSPERYIDRGSVTRHLYGYREEHLVGEENDLVVLFDIEFSLTLFDRSVMIMTTFVRSLELKGEGNGRCTFVCVCVRCYALDE